ncbi:MAG: hypothetical protein H7X93_13750, partial [Sphingomonadaceae bacterium]|nr:hypothetical protein [Sphingomonadaceae bacterium]
PGEHRPLLLVDETLRADAWADAARASASHNPLERELVRQWRGGLGALVLAHSPALAIVRWDKAMVLEGLAREAGLRTRRSRLSRAVSRIAIG